MLATAAKVAQESLLPSRQRFFLCQRVIVAYVEHGKRLLKDKDTDALDLLDDAYKLITGHLVRAVASMHTVQGPGLAVKQVNFANALQGLQVSQPLAGA